MKKAELLSPEKRELARKKAKSVDEELKKIDFLDVIQSFLCSEKAIEVKSTAKKILVQLCKNAQNDSMDFIKAEVTDVTKDFLEDVDSFFEEDINADFKAKMLTVFNLALTDEESRERLRQSFKNVDQLAIDHLSLAVEAQCHEIFDIYVDCLKEHLISNGSSETTGDYIVIEIVL